MSKILIDEEVVRHAWQGFRALMHNANDSILDEIKDISDKLLKALNQAENAKKSQAAHTEYVFIEDTVTTRVKRKNDKIKVRAKSGYAPGVKKLCTVKDTGNGFVVKMHSRRGQHQYITLDYSHAAYLLMALLAENAAGELMGKIEVVDVNEKEQQ